MKEENRSRIISVGTYIPEKVLKTIDIEKRIGFKEKLGLPYGLLEKLTGCRELHVANPEMNSSDLAYKASLDALIKAKVTPEEIDVVIFCACCQDIMEPATANIIQDKLGALNAQVFDVKNACNAFLNGIDIADSMIRTSKASTVLITTGEIGTRWVDYNINSRDDFKTRMAGLTLGDAGASVIIKKFDYEEHGIVGSFFKSEGKHWNLAVVMTGGTKYPRDPPDRSLTYFISDSEKIIELALENVSRAIIEVLKKIGWSPTDVDLVISHQVTVKIIKDIAECVKIPFERCMITVDRYGNTAAASIPLTLNDALNRGVLKPGMKVLLIGGAAGFSAGVIALVW